MNPFKWKRQHQIALALSIIVGAALGVLAGYTVYAVAQGAEGGVTFQQWVGDPIFRHLGWWAIAGAVIGGTVLYIKRLSSN